MGSNEWSILRAALAALRRDSLPLPIWWRDDDAVEPTAALERLHKTAERLSVPVHLAIIPKVASAELATFICENSTLIPITHGWAHDNHAPADKKKSEYGTGRAEAFEEFELAFSRMSDLFPQHHLPVFAPPWNRINPLHFSGLKRAGYKAVSTFTPRQIQYATEGLLQINTHIDPIDWRGSRDLIEPDILIVRIAETLEARRRGEADSSEPLGYLTHHLVHTEKVWNMSEQIITELLEGGAHVQTLSALWETTV